MLLSLLPKRLRKLIFRDYFGSRATVRRRLGSRWLLSYKNYIDRKLIIHEPFEREQLLFMSGKICELGCDTFVDAGANFGLYSIFLASRCQQLANIYAFEPSIKNYEQLCTNIALNKLSDRVNPIKIALSDSQGSIEFLENTGPSTGTSRILETAPQTTKFANFTKSVVEKATLDAVLPNLRAARVAMKIDVEGHELNLIRGAEKIIRDNFIFLQIELLEQIDTKIDLLSNRYGLTPVGNIGSDFYFMTKNK